MKVLCINPPSRNPKYVREGRCMQREASWSNLWMPLTLAYLTSILRKEGHEVVLKDATAEEMSFEELKREVKKFGPEAVVINTAIPTALKEDLRTAELVKEVDEEIKTLMIGIPCALPLLSEQLIEKTAVDFCVYGEPEVVVPELLRKLKRPWRVPGLLLKGGKKTKRPNFLDLNDLPFPAFQDLPLDAYRLPFSREKVAMVETSRGCPHNCVFCVTRIYYGKKVRLRDPEKIWREMVWTYENFGISQFFFWADSFTLNRRHVMRLCEIIKRNKSRIKDLGWIANSRADDVDEGMIRAMREAGCWLLGFGVESLVQPVLDRSKKGTKVEQVRKAVEMCRKYGIESVAHIIFGLPGESEETIKETVRKLKEIDPDYANFYILVPYPGTEVFKDYLSKGYISNQDWSKYEALNANISLPGLPPKRLEELRRKAFLSFYLSPRKLFGNFWKRRKPKRLAYFLLDGFKFLRGWVLT